MPTHRRFATLSAWFLQFLLSLSILLSGFGDSFARSLFIVLLHFDIFICPIALSQEVPSSAKKAMAASSAVAHLSFSVFLVYLYNSSTEWFGDGDGIGPFARMWIANTAISANLIGMAFLFK